MKTAEAFVLPEEAEVAQLLIQRMNESTITPTTPVILLNRGRKPLEMMYDGNHIPIPVGYCEIEFGAAKHFQDRAVVPGTRNIEVGGHVSWFAIVGTADRRVTIDPPEMCVPFTDEELTTYGEALEAIDRSSMSGNDRFVVPVRTSAARAMSRNQGAGGAMRAPGGQYLDGATQVSEAAREAAEHVLDPIDPAFSETRQAEAAAQSEPVDDGGPAPAPRPLRMGKSRR